MEIITEVVLYWTVKVLVDVNKPKNPQRYWVFPTWNEFVGGNIKSVLTNQMTIYSNNDIMKSIFRSIPERRHLVFKENVYRIIKVDFLKYLDLKDRTHTPETKERYRADLMDYMDNHLMERTMVEDYCDVFNVLAMREFLQARKSSTAKAAIGNLLEFFKFNTRITATQYLDAQQELKRFKSKQRYEPDFLTSEDLSFLINKLFVDTTAKNPQYILLRAVFSLAFDLFHEQRDIYSLTWGDIDLTVGSIKNPRGADDSLVLERLPLVGRALEAIGVYRQAIVTLQGEPTPETCFMALLLPNPNAINTLLGLVNDRAVFYNQLSSRIGVQKLIRSRILHDLEDSSGNALIDHYQILGTSGSHAQLKAAVREYLARRKSALQNEAKQDHVSVAKIPSA